MHQVKWTWRSNDEEISICQEKYELQLSDTRLHQTKQGNVYEGMGQKVLASILINLEDFGVNCGVWYYMNP